MTSLFDLPVRRDGAPSCVAASVRSAFRSRHASIAALLAAIIVLTATPLRAQILDEFDPPHGTLGGALTAQVVDLQVSDQSAALAAGPSAMLTAFFSRSAGVEVVGSLLFGSSRDIGFMVFAADLGGIFVGGWDDKGDFNLSLGGTMAVGENDDGGRILLSGGYLAVRVDHRTTPTNSIFVRAAARVYQTGEPGLGGAVGFCTRW